MFRIALCALFLALAGPAGAHWDPTPHTHTRSRSYSDQLYQDLERQRRETIQQQDRYRDRYNTPSYGNPLTTMDCLGENFRSCQGLPPKRRW